MQRLSAGLVKRFAVECGADLVGVASIDCFAGVPAFLDPAKTLLPTVKSIVVLVKRIPRGCYRGNLEGTNFTSYTYYGDVFLQHRYYLYRVDYEVACFIEKFGWEAVPTQGIGLHFKLAAVAAGLGQMGWHQLLITPEYGPRQRIGIVATEAELEADAPFTGVLCDPEDCGYRCVAECPYGAIPKTRKKTVTLAGKTMMFSELNLERCLPNCLLYSKYSPFIAKDVPGISMVNFRWRGGMPLANSLIAYSTRSPMGASPTSGAIVDCYHMLYRQAAPPAMALRGGMGCMEACIEYLEEKGKIKQFKSSFRKRKPWKLE